MGPSPNISIHSTWSRHRILKCNRKGRRGGVTESVLGCARKQPAAPQSYSFYLEIYHLRETATGSVIFGQHCSKKLQDKLIFAKNPVVSSEMECIARF